MNGAALSRATSRMLARIFLSCGWASGWPLKPFIPYSQLYNENDVCKRKSFDVILIFDSIRVAPIGKA